MTAPRGRVASTTAPPQPVIDQRLAEQPALQRIPERLREGGGKPRARRVCRSGSGQRCTIGGTGTGTGTGTDLRDRWLCTDWRLGHSPTLGTVGRSWAGWTALGVAGSALRFRQDRVVGHRAAWRVTVTLAVRSPAGVRAGRQGMSAPGPLRVVSLESPDAGWGRCSRVRGGCGSQPGCELGSGVPAGAGRERLGLSEALLGIVAALAADAPEVTAAVAAIAGHQQGLGAGVVIGSNVFNLAALLGLGAVVAGRVRLHRKVVVLGGTVAMIVAAVCLMVVAGVVPPTAGFVLVLITVALYAVALGPATGGLPASGCPGRGSPGSRPGSPAPG